MVDGRNGVVGAGNMILRKLKLSCKKCLKQDKDFSCFLSYSFKFKMLIIIIIVVVALLFMNGTSIRGIW